jgi:hypothetical protein
MIVPCARYGKVKTTSYSGFEKLEPQDNVFFENRQVQKVDDFVIKMWITFFDRWRR